jgi:hypothetical protein
VSRFSGSFPNMKDVPKSFILIRHSLTSPPRMIGFIGIIECVGASGPVVASSAREMSTLKGSPNDHRLL